MVEPVEVQKNVSFNEEFFQGHFAHRPPMPGVLLLEALAQAAGRIAIVWLCEAADDPALYCFGGIDGARFKRPVEPGDQPTLDVELWRRNSGVFKFKASGQVEEHLAVETELLCTRTLVA